MEIGFELDDRGVAVRVPVGSRIFTFLEPNLLYNGYGGSFPASKDTGA
jgi:hypothetical protein